jgi:hypothetical protein
MKQPLRDKRAGAGVDIRTFTGQSGRTYIVFKTRRDAFHVFVETEAKAAAVDCGSGLARDEAATRTHWERVWR